MEKFILAGIGILVCVVVIFALNLVFRAISKKKSKIYIKFINSVLNVVLTAGCIYYILSLFDSTRGISKTLLTSSALIIAIATFAAQQALGNVISGFSLSLSKAYNLGDKVKVVNSSNVIAEGVINDITIRHTVIRTLDGQDAIVPNSVMDSSVILNANYSEKCGNFLEIEIAFDSDIDKAIEIFRNLCIKNKYTLNDESTVVTASRISANGVVLKTVVWAANLDNNFRACSEIRIALVKEFAENKITIPYNTISLTK